MAENNVFTNPQSNSMMVEKVDTLIYYCKIKFDFKGFNADGSFIQCISYSKAALSMHIQLNRKW